MSYFHILSGGAPSFCDFIMSYDLQCDKRLRGHWAGAEMTVPQGIWGTLLPPCSHTGQTWNLLEG